MAARFCSHCGSPLVANSSFCASCGAPVGGIPPPPAPPGTPPPLTFPAPPPYAPYPPYASAYPAAGGGPPPLGEADRNALSHVSLAAILGLVGAVLIIVVPLFTPLFAFTSASTVGSGTSVSLDLSGLFLLATTGAITLVFTVIELWFFRQAFGTLAVGDRRFSTPATLTLLALLALIIIVVAVVALVAVVYQAILCAGVGNTITSTCLNVGAALAMIAVVAIAAIVLLVGYIGLLIGIWRLGTRYGQGMFQAGAILLIFPLLGIVGLILILVAARSVRGKFDSTAYPMTFG